MTGDAAVTRVRAEAGVDVDVTTAKLYIQEKLNEAFAESKFFMAEVSLGTTTADDRTYAIPATVVDLDLVYKVDADSNVFEYRTKVSQSDMVGLRNGRLSSNGEGAFAANFEADGDALVELWPAPDTAGETLTGFGAINAPTISWGSELPLPSGLHTKLVNGAIGEALAVVESRADEAPYFEASFQDLIVKLRARKNSRVGSGVQQMAVDGY